MTEEAIVLKKSSYEPWVTEEDGHLIYHLPVESGFASLLFKFKITPDQLAILEADEERFYFLFALLHHRYQMLRSVLAPETDSDFDAILFGSIPDVEQVLNLADAESRGAVSNLVLRTMGRGPRTVWFGRS